MRKTTIVAAASLAFVALFFAAGPASGQEKSAGGLWQGAIELPGSELGISITLELVAGAWTGKIDIPAQNARGLNLSEVRVEAATVSWKIAASSARGRPASSSSWTRATSAAASPKRQSHGAAAVPPASCSSSIAACPS